MQISSRGSHPGSPSQIRVPAALVESPIITPVLNVNVDRPRNIRIVDRVDIPAVDSENGGRQLPGDEEPIIPPAAQNPRDEPQQPRGVDPGIPDPNPAGANNAQSHPPPPTTAPPGDIPQADPKQQANWQLRKQAQKIVEECQEFLEIYEGIQLNSPLLIQIVAESNKLLANLSNCGEQLDDGAELADVVQEIKKWKRILKTFVVSMLGRYKDPATTPTSPPPTSPPPMQSTHAPRERRDASPNTLDLLRRDLVFFTSKLQHDVLPDIGVGADVTNSKLRDLHDFMLPQITKAIEDCRKALKS